MEARSSALEVHVAIAEGSASPPPTSCLFGAVRQPSPRQQPTKPAESCKKRSTCPRRLTSRGRMSTLGTVERPLCVAAIGSGPSGFYAAEALFKAPNLTVRVDGFDRLRTP